MNGIPQLPTPSQFLFSLPSIREKVSMQSLKLLMYQHQYEQASTAPKASELKSRWSQLRLLLGSHPARGGHTPHTEEASGYTAAPAANQGSNANKTKQDGHLHHLWENAIPERGRDRKSQPGFPSKYATRNKKGVGEGLQRSET